MLKDNTKFNQRQKPRDSGGVQLIIKRTDELVEQLDLTAVSVHLHVVSPSTGDVLNNLTLTTENSHSNNNYITWDQNFLIQTPLDELVEQDALFLFELLYQNKESKNKLQNGTQQTLKPICWAFLRLKGRKRAVLGNLQLQLFKYKFSENAQKQRADQIFAEWRYMVESSTKRNPYPSSLFIELQNQQKQIKRNSLMTPENNDEIPPDQQIQTQEIHNDDELVPDENTNQISHYFETGIKSDIINNYNKKTFRNVQDSCQIPNSYYDRSENHPNGCSALAFSSQGDHIAAACGLQNGKFNIIIYNIHTVVSVKQFNGHHDLIHDLVWSNNDELIASASSDFTVRIWHTSSVDNEAIYIFRHDRFVYAVQFHPTQNFLFTGDYYGNLYLWDLNSGQMSQKIKISETGISALCVDLSGFRLYAGTIGGLIIEGLLEYNDSTINLNSNQDQNFEFQYLRESKELKGSSICSLQIHTRGRRMLVGAKGHNLCLMDLKGLIICKKYLGLRCQSQKIVPCLSPDGNYVVCGSEDGQTMLYDITGASRNTLKFMYWRNETLSCVRWCPSHHMIAACCLASSSPVILYVYDENSAQISLHGQKMNHK